MQKNKNKRKKKLLIWLFSLIALLILLVLFIKFAAEPFIERRIKETLEKTNNGYKITADNIHVGWLPPGIIINRITVKTTRDSANLKINGTIGTIELKRISIFRALFSNDMACSALNFNDGEITIISGPGQNDQKPIILKNSILIRKTDFNNIHFKFINEKDQHSYYLSGIQTRLKQISFNKSDTFDTQKIKLQNLYCKESGWYSADSIQSCLFYGISLPESDGNVHIDSVHYLPLYEGYKYTDLFEYQTDRIEIKARDIDVVDFSPERLVNTGDILSSSVLIENLQVNSFRDKRKKFLHHPRLMPQQIIGNYKGKLHVDSIIVESGTMVYSEHAEDSDQPGTVYFTKTKFLLKNINNDPNVKQNLMSVKASALLMDKGKTEILMLMMLFDPKLTFSVRGSIGNMQLDALNPVYENNEFITLSGQCNSLNFEFTADSTAALGSMTFLYQDLRLEIKNKNGHLRDKVSTWIANYRIINFNPLSGQDTRIGRIDYKRDPERFIFNYSVKAIMTGIQSTVTNN